MRIVLLETRIDASDVDHDTRAKSKSVKGLQVVSIGSFAASSMADGSIGCKVKDFFCHVVEVWEPEHTVKTWQRPIVRNIQCGLNATMK